MHQLNTSSEFIRRLSRNQQTPEESIRYTIHSNTKKHRAKRFLFLSFSYVSISMLSIMKRIRITIYSLSFFFCSVSVLSTLLRTHCRFTETPDTLIHSQRTLYSNGFLQCQPPLCLNHTTLTPTTSLLFRRFRFSLSHSFSVFNTIIVSNFHVFFICSFVYINHRVWVASNNNRRRKWPN